MLKKTDPRLAKTTLALACHSLEKHHLPRIELCLARLSEKDIWWRPHPSSNSIGNLVLHLNGNVRQWIISGLGGQSFHRERDKEFSEQGPLPRHQLVATLKVTVRKASRLIKKLRGGDLQKEYMIQGIRVTGLQALLHVTEHFAFHTGQIIYITKLRLREDLDFTRLPGDLPGQRRRSRLPVL